MADEDQKPGPLLPALKPECIPISACGSTAAHLPHLFASNQMMCSGIMPIWPCPIHQTHPDHTVTPFTARLPFHCPGTGVIHPVYDRTGPQYSEYDARRYVQDELSQMIRELDKFIARQSKPPRLI